MKKIISALCAIVIAFGATCPVFAAQTISTTAQVTQEQPLKFSDKKIKTASYEQGRLEYEMPETWTLENLEDGAMFTGNSYQVFIRDYNLDQALSGKDAAYVLMDTVIDKAFVSNPGFESVEVLSKENITFLSSYAMSCDIGIKQDGSQIKFKTTLFTSPDLKSYAMVFMPVVSLASAGELGVQVDEVINKVSNEYYEMILNSMKWKSSPTQSNTQQGIVYWTPGGKSYHHTKDCASLKRSKTIKSGSLQDAISAGKSDPCNLCVK